jgi:hypothetical protein
MGRDFASGALHLDRHRYGDNRRACAMTLMLFATGIALSVLLISAYRPGLLKQVIVGEATLGN